MVSQRVSKNARAAREMALVVAADAYVMLLRNCLFNKTTSAETLSAI